MEKSVRFTNSYPMSRRAFIRFAGIAGGASLLSACVAPVAPEGGQAQESAAPAAARTTLRLQSSFPVDYPNTLVMSQDVFGEYMESHPNYEVEVNFVPVPDVARSFVQALEVDQAPDFFYAFESQGTLSYLNHLYDLTDLVEDAGLTDDFYQNAKDLWTTADGKLVGIPTYYGTKCYVYRADIWDEAGLDPDQFPTTWDEFVEVVVKLTKKDASGVNIRDGYHMFDDMLPDSEHLVQHIHQNGGSEYSGDSATGPAAINSPEALEAFTWWLDLVRVHGVESPQGTIAPEGTDRIMDGYTGVELQGPWWVPPRRRNFPEVLDQGLVRVGAPLTRTAQVGHLDASGWGVNAHSDILEDVLDFVRTFLKDEHYMHYFQSQSEDGETVFWYPTARRSINEHPDFWIANEPLIQGTAFMEAFDYGKSTARMHLGFVEVRSNVYPRMCEQGLFGQGDDQALLDEAAAEMDAITERTRQELE
jgi:ABC-type glycerol-3-phosphate transport system substrate-binding protein